VSKAQATEELVKGSTYKIFTQLNVNEYTAAGICDNNIYLICKNNKVKIQNIISDKYIIEVKTFWETPGECALTVVKAKTYCIAKDLLEAAVPTPPISLSIGILTVPFKYEFNTQKVFGGVLALPSA
jgi:hypothetical protein